MKKITISISMILSLLLIFSCGNPQEKKDYDKIKSSYKSFINTDADDINALENKAINIKKDMQTFTLNYPESKYYSEINNLLNNIDENVSNNLYNSLLNKKNKIENDNYFSYDNELSEYNQLISEGELIYNKMKDASLSDKLTELIDNCKDKRSSVMLEKDDYELLSSTFGVRYNIVGADTEIEEIEYFLDKYPNSIMNDELESRIEDLIVLKFNILYKQEINKIQTLNTVVKQGNEFINQLSDEDKIDEIQSKIDELENSRQTLFKKEWDMKLEEMKGKMRDEAIAYSNNYVHNICRNVLSSRLIDESKNEYLNKTVIQREYQLQNKGGGFCSKIFKTTINVVAELTGDLQNGTQYKIDAELVSDYKIN